MGHAYPILLDLAGELVVIVGGGAVAARKATGLIAAGATVRAVAPRFCEPMPREVQRVGERYRPELLAGARLVFAATDDPSVNDAVVRDAKSAGMWVNRADADDADGVAGSFIVPAKFENEGVIVAVSAGSAAASVAIRDRLKAGFDPAWSEMASLARKLRPLVRASGLAPSRRAAILREMIAVIEERVKEERVKEGLRAPVKVEEAVLEWLRGRLAEEGYESK